MSAERPDKSYIPHTPLRATVTSGNAAKVTFPLGVGYFEVRQTAGAGTIQWSAISEAEALNAATAWIVDADNPSDRIIASPYWIWIAAAGGDVTYEVLIVREGKTK